MSINRTASKIIYKLQEYKDHLIYFKKNKSIFENEDNINSTLKYIFDHNFGDTYSKLFDIGYNYMDFIHKTKINDSNRPQTKISKETLLDYSKRVLDSIDPSLNEELSNFKLDGSIIYSNKIKRLLTRNNISNMEIRKLNTNKGRRLKYVININEELTYETIKTFIHEFMHFVSGNNVPKKEFGNEVIYNKNIDEQKYGEFISIYFEEYAKEYMVNKMGISNDEFDNTFRIKDTKLQEHYKSIYLPFKIYNEYGKYNYDNYKLFIESNSLDISTSKEEYENNKKKFLNVFGVLIAYNIENEKKYEEHPNLLKNNKHDEFMSRILKEDLYNNNYVLGTLLAFYAKDKILPKEMIRFAKMINNDDKVELYKDPLYKKVDDMYEEILDGKFDYNILINHLKSNNNLEKGVTI